MSHIINSGTVKMLLKKRLFHRYRLLLIMLLSPVLHAAKGSSADVSVGMGAIDNGDDRSHPVAVGHLGFSNQWMIRGYYWGREQRPVKETNALMTVAKNYDVAGGKTLHAATGLSLLAETTEITYKDFPEENTKSTSTNAGLFLGASWDLINTGKIKVNASWEGHIFPAGSAALLLVTGRKQVLAITGGIAL